jgi:hypothetical protein
VYQGRHRSFPGALIGMKPPAFAEWMFRLLVARAVGSWTRPVTLARGKTHEQHLDRLA